MSRDRLKRANTGEAHAFSAGGAEDAVVVGDTPYDVEAARKRGIAAIAIRSGGFPDKALEDAGASALYDDVAALLKDYDGSPLAIIAANGGPD